MPNRVSSILTALRGRVGPSQIIAGLGASFILALVVGLALLLEDLLRGEITRAVERTERFAQNVEHHTSRALDSSAFTIERVRDQLAINPRSGLPADSDFTELLARIVRPIADARVLVTDRNGAVRHAAPEPPHEVRSYLGSETLVAHLQGMRGLRIALVDAARPGDERRIEISSRLDDALGAFAGMIVLTLPSRSLVVGEGAARAAGIDVVELSLADGTLIARAPSDAAAFAADAATKATRAAKYANALKSDLLEHEDRGGAQRIVRYRHLADWPLVAAVKSDAAFIRASWLEEASRYTVLAVVIGVIVVALMVLLIRQMARRQASERQLRTALDNVTEAFAIFDAADRLVLCTRSYAIQHTGAERPEELVGLGYEEITRRSIALGEQPERGQTPEQWIATCVERHRAPPAQPWMRRLANERWALVSERRLPDGGTVGISTDITTIKQRERQIEDARRDAELANHAKTRFLAAMSHELRTPLNAIIGFSEMIKDKRFGAGAVDRYANYAADIHRSGQHLLQLISDLLDLSKIEAGRFELNAQNINVAAAIEEAVGMLRERARAGDVTISTRVGPDLPLLHADARLLRQILLNLLSNAVKFTPTGGKAELRAAMSQDGRLELVVSDTGVGINRRMRKRLFEPFAQAESALVRNHDGTGLGLTITRGFVELHGATIRIDSEEGRGTTATVSFPAERLKPTDRVVKLRAGAGGT